MENSLRILKEEELQSVIKTIFKRSQTDLKFRKLCLDDPRQAIFELTGKRLPEGKSITFVE